MKRNTMKRKLALLLAMVLLATPIAELKVQAEEAGQNQAEQAEAYSYETDFTITSSWEGHYNATITIENTGDTTIHNWHLGFESSDTIESLWNGTVYKEEDGYHVIKNAGWNGDIAPGESVTFGFLAGCEEEPDTPENYTLPVGEIRVDEGDYTAEFTMENTWDSSFSGAGITIKNLTGEPMEDWSCSFDFAGAIPGDGSEDFPVEITLLWDGEIISHEGNRYTIKHAVNNPDIPAGGEVTFGFNGEWETAVSGNDITMPQPTNITLCCMGYDPEAGENSGGQDGNGEQGEAGGNTEAGGTVSGNDVSGNDPLEEMDSDGDGILDAAELRLGFDPYSADTDGDGMPDGYELYTLYPVLLEKGYPEEAGMLPEDDYDEDGLTNLEEYLANTHPGNADTDGDGLDDYEEIHTYETKPDSTDTDGDGLNDGLEISQGMNPDHTDTDGDGTPDGEETITQLLTVEETTKKPLSEAGVLPTLAITGKGDYSTRLTILDISYNKMYENTGFILGSAYEFSHDKEPVFESAILTFRMDENLLGKHRLEDLAIAWYDNDNNRVELLPTIHDGERNTLTAELSHFSTYVVVDAVQYRDNLKEAYFSEQEKVITFGGHSYILMEDYRTYEEAEVLCEELGGTLAVMESSEELDFISGWLKELKVSEDCFIKGVKTDNGVETMEKQVLVDGKPVTYADWQGRPYRYRYYTEQEYTSVWLSNVIYDSTLVSSYPLFAFYYGSGTKEGIGEVPVDYYQIYAFDAGDKRSGVCGVTDSNGIMERYSYHYVYSSDAPVQISSVLYDRRYWEQSVRTFLYCGPSDYISPRSAQELDGSTPAYTVFDTEIPVFSRYEDVLSYFRTGDQSGQGNIQAVNTFQRGMGKTYFLCELDREISAKKPSPTKVLLSNGKFVTLDADPALGDLSVDTDGDSIPDIIELGNPKSIKLQGTNLEITEWQYRSDPVLTDTDADGFPDNNDLNPTKYDVAVEQVAGNGGVGTVIRLNTGAIWRVSGLKDLNEFYEQYYVRIFNISPGGKEYLESVKRTLDANKESNFTIEELATFQQIDLPGVVDYMDGRGLTFKKQVLSEVRGEPCTDEAARSAYSIVSAASAWTDYFRVTWNQIVRGKFAEETNLLGTIGEVGLAFVGMDFVQDLRDFSHDLIFWEDTLQHKVETVIDGASVLPVVGILAKGDEILALFKAGDKVIGMRKLEKLTDLKELDSVRYIDEFGLMPGTAGDMLIDIDGSTYRMILETSSEYNFYRNCYNNPIAEGFADCSEAVGYLKTTSPGTLQEIIEEAAKQTGKSADEVEEFVEEALEDAWKKVDAGGDVLKPGIYTEKIKWGIHEIEVRPEGNGFWGQRIKQSDTRVDQYELKINPNNESYYLSHPDGGYVQFENIVNTTVQDGKLVMQQNSFYHVYDMPDFAKSKILDEAKRQIDAANEAGYTVEWLVSDNKAVDQLTKFFEEENVDIIVTYYPE